jgi:TatA/E family protein of Tat protein translocase
MFGSLGLPELLLIFGVALIVFGPRRLPEIGRTIGKALGEFKRASEELKTTLEREVAVDEMRNLTNITTPQAETVSRSEPAPAITVEPVSTAPASPRAE